MSCHLLSDIVTCAVGFVNCLLRDSPSLPGLLGRGQQDWYTNGTLRKQFTEPTVQVILSISKDKKRHCKLKWQSHSVWIKKDLFTFRLSTNRVTKFW